MEASNITRGLEDEEHSSSESGWTMYIGSLSHEKGHNNSIGEYSYNNMSLKQEQGYGKNQCRQDDDDDDESDDSMASDASSGPIHHKFQSSCEQNLGMDHYKRQTSISTEKLLHKQVTKRDQVRRNKMGKEKFELKAISAASHVQSRGKVEMISHLGHEE